MLVQLEVNLFDIHITDISHIRLVFTEEENKSLKTEQSELRARHKLELEKVRKDKEKEMEQVHERY